VPDRAGGSDSDDHRLLCAGRSQLAGRHRRTGAQPAGPVRRLDRSGAVHHRRLWLLGIVVVLAAWGLRFLLHRGGERAFSRAIFAPIAVALASVYAATLVPGPGWGHSFGLGGLFGDTVLGAILSAAPVQASFGLRMISVLLAVTMVAMGLFVTGVVRHEMRAAGRFLLLGLLVAYSAAVSGLWRAARGTYWLARAAYAGYARRRQSRARPAPDRHDTPVHGAPGASRVPPVVRAEPYLHSQTARQPDRPVTPRRPVSASEPRPAPQAEIAARPRAKSGLLARLPDLVRRPPDPEPELVENDLSQQAALAGEPSGERIKARIADVIRARSRQVPRKVVQHPPRKPRRLRAAPRPRRSPRCASTNPRARIRTAAAVAADQPRLDRAPPSVRRGAGGKRPDAGERARRLWRQGRDRQRPARPGGHACTNSNPRRGSRPAG
jgi:DNA segregation ATPase FtsK/SpoIIIE, S-DNA-T family